MTSLARLAFPLPNEPLLRRSLLLAVLLHVWLVLVFGNAAGTAAPGQGVWARLTVTLRGDGGGSPQANPGDAAPAVDDNAEPGKATHQRFGGRVRQESPDDNAPPGAAELGRWSPQEAASPRQEAPAPSPATLEAPQAPTRIESQRLEAPAAQLQATPATVTPVARSEPLQLNPSTPPAPDTVSPSELPAPVRRLEASQASLVPPTTSLAPAALQRLPTPAAEPLPVPKSELPAAVQRLDAAPPPLTALPAPTNLRPRPTEALPSPALPATELPSPVKRLEAEADGSQRPAPAVSRVRPSLAPASSAALTPAAELPTPVRRLEAADSGEAPGRTLPSRQDLRTPGPAAQGESARLTAPSELPAPVRRLDAADGGTTVTPLPPAAVTRGVEGLPPGGAVAADLATPLPGQVQVAPSGAKAGSGSPDAGSQVGRDVATPPSATPAPNRPLNLSLPRGAAAARRTPGLLELLPQPPERKTEMQKKIEEATREDCRNAHADKGLLAALPLVLSPARDQGCKW